MVNFNVISAPDRRLTDYDGFKQDYLNSELNYHELKSKYGLSKKEYSETAKRIREEENLEERPNSRAKYFYDTRTSHTIVKTINMKTYTIGSFPKSKFSAEDVARVVEECKKLNWDIELCRSLIDLLKKVGVSEWEKIL